MGSRRVMRVLIVDDEASNRTFAERALGQAGYEVAVASDGLEALAITEKGERFDLLLADLIMPGMRGDELARQLHRIDPNLKVLYFTGYSDRLFIEQTAREEHEAFVDKPVTVNGLLEAVSLILFGHTHGP